MSEPMSEMSPEGSRGGSQAFIHTHPTEDYGVVGQEEFQHEIVSKRTRSDGTISEHELKHTIHDETLIPLSKTSTMTRRPVSPERVSKSSGRSTPRRSLSPRKLDTAETKGGSTKTRRSVSPESVQVQTQTSDAPPPRAQPSLTLPCPPLIDDYPPPRTFDSHRDIRRSSCHPGLDPSLGTGVVYRGFDEPSPKDPCRLVPRGPNEGTVQDGDRLSPGDASRAPNWFVLHGTDYGPVLVSKEQLKLCDDKVSRKKPGSTASGPFTPMLTVGNEEYGPFAGLFDGVNNPREVAVIWDRENMYQNVLQKKPAYDGANPVSSCFEIDAHGGIQKSRRPVPTVNAACRFEEAVRGSDYKKDTATAFNQLEEASERISSSKPTRNIERLTNHMCDLETQVSCLAMEKSMLRDKLTQATLMISELSQSTPPSPQKCTSTNTEPSRGECDYLDAGSKSDAEIRKAERDYICAQKKAIELQNEIRELKSELQHLNDERLRLEMQQRQDERCKLELYEELDASKKIEKEMKSCFQFLERQNQRNEDEVQSTRLKLATLIQTLQPDSKPVTDVLLRESTKTLQCMLEKVVSSVQCQYVQTRSELDDTLEELRGVKAAVGKAEVAAQGNSLKVQRLKDKLRQLKESMQCSMTDLTSKVKSREKDLDCANERLQELLQQCTEKEQLARNSQTRLDRLENQLHNLEVERNRCLLHLDEHRNKCKNKVDRLKDKYQQRIKCLMERLRDACQDCDLLRGKVLQLQNDENRVQEDGEKLSPLLGQLERSCREASNVMESLQQTIRMRDDSDISECKKRLDDLDCRVCKVASDCSINQCKSPAISDLASRLNEALKLIETLKTNTQTGNRCRKHSWNSCQLVPRVVKAATSSTHVGPCCRTIERMPDDRAAEVQRHIDRAQAWAQSVLQSTHNSHAPSAWSTPCPPPPPPPGLAQTPFCTVYPPSPVFYNYPYSQFPNFPTSPKCSPATVQMPTTTTTTCNFVEHGSPRAIAGCTNTFSQGELKADNGCDPATSPPMTYQLSSRTIGMAKHDLVFPAFTKNSEL